MSKGHQTVTHVVQVRTCGLTIEWIIWRLRGVNQSVDQSVDLQGDAHIGWLGVQYLVAIGVPTLQGTELPPGKFNLMCALRQLCVALDMLDFLLDMVVHDCAGDACVIERRGADVVWANTPYPIAINALYLFVQVQPSAPRGPRSSRQLFVRRATHPIVRAGSGVLRADLSGPRLRGKSDISIVRVATREGWDPQHSGGPYEVLRKTAIRVDRSIVRGTHFLMITTTTLWHQTPRTRNCRHPVIIEFGVTLNPQFNSFSRVTWLSVRVKSKICTLSEIRAGVSDLHVTRNLC
jgi:hypothetical protein